MEKDSNEKIPYAYPVGNFIYAQVCIRSDIAYTKRVFRRF